MIDNSMTSCQMKEKLNMIIASNDFKHSNNYNNKNR